jgi:dTDP-4-dehydrorhamnose 3,5-epimerase-like enzyme
MSNLKKIKFKIIGSRNSFVSVFEKEKLFNVKRFFILEKLKKNEIRGNHAHKKCYQFIISMNGTLKIETVLNNKNKVIILKGCREGLYVPPYCWVKLTNLNKDNSILVLCSHIYSENDYIRNYDDFSKIK